MKSLLIRLSCLITLCFSALAWSAERPLIAASTPRDYLLAMQNAHKTLNYELYYLLEDGNRIESLRYRHSFEQGKEYAQLYRLDNAREEIILRDKRVSYFGYDFQPFGLKGEQILDNLPALFHTDFSRLQHYDFIELGRERVADRSARVIRIVPKDNYRFQHIAWIDEQNGLLLKSETLNREGQKLEEFRVIQQRIEPYLDQLGTQISSLMLPMTLDKSNATPLYWQPRWLPSGFNEMAASKPNLTGAMLNGEEVESRLYSDGIASFTVYLLKNQGVLFNEQFWQQGKLGIFTQTEADKDIIIVGDIPLEAMRLIAHDIHFSSPTPAGENQDKPQ